MNLQQAKIILEKINRLYQSITLDSNIDVHEQELMLSYIRQFYASFSTDGSVIVKSAVKDKTPVAPVAKSDPVVIRKEKPKMDLPEEIEAHVAPPKPEPVKIKKEPSVSVAPPAEGASKSSKPTFGSEEIDDLFQQQQAKELSEHLSDLPIKDLTKSMGLNEKILTTNELFGKDNEAFNNALKSLNGCKNFEEAKNHLAEYAETFGWTKKSKKKKAQIFIKLVRRRFK